MNSKQHGRRQTDRKKEHVKSRKNEMPHLQAGRRDNPGGPQFAAVKFFTLVELLIVIAIIAILAAMLLPALNKARAKAHSSSCLSKQKQIAQAILMYADDYKFLCPTNNQGTAAADGVQRTVRDMLRIKNTRQSVLACPADKRPNLIRTGGIITSYNINNHTVFQDSAQKNNTLSSFRHPARASMFADGFQRYYYSAFNQNFFLAHGQGCNFNFVDGHAEYAKINYYADTGVPDATYVFTTVATAWPWGKN